ncbi:Protein kinase domain [Carpediemonas membranifera]|uniref:non-specific serine/threonine protein kinase n=1 Tax=Carpediemonas membranifera TaxID=201153 RepID=A0A8J6E481_9EUKA|nr:Protein kinase domain [Carpediemonas membranifera]|eukprot:KAG9396878.1 Protein kinase domain [Carpediemonas membranifera]
MLAPGSLIKDRWKIVKSLGQGAFGQIYECNDLETGKHHAIKLERRDSKRSVLKIEVAFMRKVRKCPSVPSYITCGTTRSFNFLVMEMCGVNLSNLRKSRPEQRFSLTTVLKLGISMVACMKDVHAAGYVHRDIKPSNFVLGNGNNRVYIIDFGLARRYIDDHGEPQQPRGDPGFRGTARYASVASHQGKDLAPRDDYWSLLYLMIEMLTGFLPWRRQKERDRIGDVKALCLTHDTLTSGLPACFQHLLDYLNALNFTDPINAEYIQTLFLDEIRTRSLSVSTDYDWCQPIQPELYTPTTALYSTSKPSSGKRHARDHARGHGEVASTPVLRLPSVSTAHSDAPQMTYASTARSTVHRLPTLDKNSRSHSFSFQSADSSSRNIPVERERRVSASQPFTIYEDDNSPMVATGRKRSGGLSSNVFSPVLAQRTLSLNGPGSFLLHETH